MRGDGRAQFLIERGCDGSVIGPPFAVWIDIAHPRMDLVGRGDCPARMVYDIDRASLPDEYKTIKNPHVCTCMGHIIE